MDIAAAWHGKKVRKLQLSRLPAVALNTEVEGVSLNALQLLTVQQFKAR